MDNARTLGSQFRPSPAKVTDKLGNSFILEPIKCPVCKQDDTKEVGLRGGKYQRLNLGIVTTIVRCRGCGLLYPNPFPFPEDPQRLYGEPEKYFEHHSIAGKVAAGKSLLEQICVKTGRNFPTVLDVGSGRGELLKAAKDTGLGRVVGLELSRAMVEYVRETWGIDVRMQSIEAHAGDNSESYDAVVLSAVLEHVYRPDLMIESAARLLRKGGVLFIDCPNEPNLITTAYAMAARFHRSRGVINLAPTFPPFHVFGFNSKSLSALLEQNGLALESICRRGASLSLRTTGFSEAINVFAANAVNAVANLTGAAHNMTVWARLVHRSQADGQHPRSATSVAASQERNPRGLH